MWDAVIIGVSQNFTRCFMRSEIPRDAEAGGLLRDAADIGKTLCDLHGGIRRAIIDDEHLVVWIALLSERFETGPQRRCAVSGANEN